MKKLQTFAVTGVLTASIALGVGIGLGASGGDAATTDAPRGVRTIVPTVAIAQPGIDFQGATAPAMQPQPGVRAGDASSPVERTGSAQPSSVAQAIQPGVGEQDSASRPVEASQPTTTGNATLLAIQPGVPAPSVVTAALTSGDWTALTFAAAYDQCAAASLHEVLAS